MVLVSASLTLVKQRDDRSTVGSRSDFHGDGKRLSSISTCQTDTNNITCHCLLFLQLLGTPLWSEN